MCCQEYPVLYLTFEGQIYADLSIETLSNVKNVHEHGVIFSRL